VVVQSFEYPATPPDVVAELKAIVQPIAIEPRTVRPQGPQRRRA